MKRLAKWILVAAVVGVGIFWWLTIPTGYQSSLATLPVLPEGNPANGELVFWAGGCSSCHAADNAVKDAKLQLGGGHRLETPFGTFLVPNISPDLETGIGAWTAHNFIDAMSHGTSPDTQHYYPSFPYASYNKMSRSDVLDLFAFLKTLPPVSRANEPHELALPFQWRRPLGIWKQLFVDREWSVDIDDADAPLVRGRYLVESLAHCGECHSPRNILGGIKQGSWLAGGPSPDGKGRIPNITPHENGIASWSKGDIVYYLESGFTPDFDSVGGSMVSVQENMSKLPKEDLEAIASYLKAVPPSP